MARPLSFDPADARRALLALFWEKGFADTSLVDLEQASGLDRRQLYNQFGDKQQLFRNALDDFHAVAGRDFLAPLEGEDARWADVLALWSAFAAMAREGDRRGCMICATAQAPVADLPGIGIKLENYFNRIEAAIANALENGRKSGEVPLLAEQVAPVAAAMTAIHVGICNAARSGRPDRTIQNMIDGARTLLR